MSFRFRKITKLGPFSVTLTHRDPTVSGGGLSYQLVGSKNQRSKNREPEDDGPTSTWFAAVMLFVFGIFGFGYVLGGSSVDATAAPANAALATSAESPVPSASEPLVETENEPEPNEPPVEDYPSPPESFKTWFDTSGKHSTKAKVVEIKGDVACLQKEDGRIGGVQIAKFSRFDQMYISELNKRNVVEGTVNGVSNGDTISVRGSKTFKVRLQGIDAPENGQDFYKQSCKALNTKIYRHNIRIEWRQKDDDGVILGHVIDDGWWINNELIEEGYAWHRDNHSPVLAKAETKAREAKLGLWSADPTPPWDYEIPSRSFCRSV